MNDGRRRFYRWVRSGLALAALTLAPWRGPGSVMRGQEPASGDGELVRDSVRVRASRDRVTFIRDPRLEADSTLFPYEWPALDQLRLELARLRPALEAGSVQELAGALPEVRARTDTLIAADPIPALLARRRDEVRARLDALAEALRRVDELTPAALAAPPDTSRAEPEGFAPLDDSPDSLGSPSILAQPSAEESPAGAPPTAGITPTAEQAAPGVAPTGEPAAEAATDSLAALDPIGIFLDAWREVYAQEEALLHRLRDPFGE